MSNEEVRLKIKIDAKSQELILMNQQVKDLGKSFTDTDSFANTFLKRINIAGHLYAGFQVINNTLGDISRTGLEVNKQLQKPFVNQQLIRLFFLLHHLHLFV